MAKKKINSFEFALNEAIGKPDLNENCEARTLQEEEDNANETLREQLKSFNAASTGEPLFPDLQKSD